VAGGYVDAWAQVLPSNPLAPWQDAPIDAAWLALSVFLTVVLGRNLRAGAAWPDALPPSYDLALAGALVFGLGALANVYYQYVFGIGQGLESLLSPPHLVQLAGAMLLIGAPLSQALKERPERTDWPVVISAACTLSALTFFTQFAHPLIDLWASHHPSAPATPWVAMNLGVAAILIQVSLLIGVVLLLVRSFSLPKGSLTAVLGINGLLVALAGRHPELVVVPLLTGLAADVLLLRLRPDAGDGALGLRAFGAALPALYALLYWLAIRFLEGGTSWTVQLWLGVVLASALAGFVISYVAGIRRPPSVVAAEVWAEVWPQRHVEVSPATVKAALDALGEPGALAASPLVRLPVITAQGNAAAAELRGLLLDVVSELAVARAPRDAEAGRLLSDYYVKRVGSHELIAERLHLSRPTFYRRLQRGLTLVAERLDELAEFTARHSEDVVARRQPN
jgi:hypothetical protein